MGTFTWGVLAGLGTACSWSVSCLVHAAASRQLGVHPFLMIRQPLAVVALGGAALLAGQVMLYPFLPMLLGLTSGLLGIALSDWLFYESVARLGVRTAQVCQSFNACITAMLGVIFLNEYLGLQGYFGLALATAGTILVVLAEQRGGSGGSADPAARRAGVIMALASACVMAAGMIFSKEAMRLGIPPLMLAFVRNLAASAVLWGAGICLHRVAATLEAARTHPMVLRWLLVGCVFGPAGGMWLSMVALDYAPAAIASTLIGLQPVVLLIMTGFLERRCPAIGSIIGCMAACGGAALLLLR